MIKHALVLTLLLIGVYSLVVEREYLSSNWQAQTNGCSSQELGESNFVLNTSIPTVLHLDLLRNNKIPDPYFGDNYKKM